MLERNRKRDCRSGCVAPRLSIWEYRELEAAERWPNWETFHRICELYGWPQTFVAPDSMIPLMARFGVQGEDGNLGR
jgi:hypothetical protein